MSGGSSRSPSTGRPLSLDVLHGRTNRPNSPAWPAGDGRRRPATAGGSGGTAEALGQRQGALEPGSGMPSGDPGGSGHDRVRPSAGTRSVRRGATTHPPREARPIRPCPGAWPWISAIGSPLQNVLPEGCRSLAGDAVWLSSTEHGCLPFTRSPRSDQRRVMLRCARVARSARGRPPGRRPGPRGTRHRRQQRRSSGSPRASARSSHGRPAQGCPTYGPPERGAPA